MGGPGSGSSFNPKIGSKATFAYQSRDRHQRQRAGSNGGTTTRGNRIVEAIFDELCPFSQAALRRSKA